MVSGTGQRQERLLRAARPGGQALAVNSGCGARGVAPRGAHARPGAAAAHARPGGRGVLPAGRPELPAGFTSGGSER